MPMSGMQPGYRQLGLDPSGPQPRGPGTGEFGEAKVQSRARSQGVRSGQDRKLKSKGDGTGGYPE